MFDVLENYKNKGHFFFTKGGNLSELSREVPDLPGVYYILRLSRGKINLVYIGKSGTIKQNGELGSQMLRGRIHNKQNGVKREDFFNIKMDDENIDGLDIYWFVTMDKTNNDLPAYVEGLLMQYYFEGHGELPLWNKEF
jgi:hypothetical protein